MANLLGALRLALGLDTAQFEKGLKDAGPALAGFAAAGVAAGNLISDGIGKALGAIKSAVTSVFDVSAELRKFSLMLQMSVDQVSALKFALEKNGSSLEQFQRMIQTIGEQSLEALTNKMSTAARTFDAIGVSVTNSNGTVKTANELYREVAEKFAGWADGAQKAQIATNLFGDASASTINLLNRGPATIDALSQKARDLGVVLSGDTASAAKSIGIAFKDIGLIFQALGTTIVNRLLPYIKPFSDGLINLIENTGILRGVLVALDTALQGLVIGGYIVKAVFQSLGAVIAAVVTAINLVMQNEWRAAMAALAQAPADAVASIKANLEEIKKVWNSTLTDMQTAGQNAAGNILPTAPIVAGMRQVRDAMREARDEARAAFQAIINEPTESFTAKWQALTQAVKDHIVTRQELGRITRQLTKEQTNQWLDLGTATATALTSIFGQNKTAAIASTIIMTSVAIMRALSTLPPPFSWAQAALAAATGAAQLANIRSTSEKGGGSAPSVSGSGGGDTQPAAQMPSQTLTVQGINPMEIFTGDQVRGLADRLLDFQRNGGKVVLA